MPVAQGRTAESFGRFPQPPSPLRVTLGLDPRALHLTGDFLPQIPPVRVALLDQFPLPPLIPALERRFALDGDTDLGMLLEVHQPLDIVALRVPVGQSLAMLLIGPPAPHVGQDVDKSAHASILK